MDRPKNSVLIKNYYNTMNKILIKNIKSPNFKVLGGSNNEISYNNKK